MNRRDALKVAVAGLASFILPAPRPRLDLRQFCRRWDYGEYSLTLPWTLNDWTYATDGHACVRVRPAAGDKADHDGKAPPFGTLPLDHAQLRGWRELPRLEPLLANHSDCPACEGTGNTARLPGHGCPRCDGMGHVWVGQGWDISVPKTCPGCKGKGFLRPPGSAVCPSCRGNAIGVFPSVVMLDGRYFALSLYERVRATGAEFVHDNYRAMPGYPMLRFVFDGGSGVLLGMDQAAVKARLVSR